MNENSFSEKQIIKALKEHEAGGRVDDICRRYGIFHSTFYSWKSKFGGLEVFEAKRLTQLEAENAELKKLLAETQQAKTALEEALFKSGMR
jgi:putative transposase